MILEGVRGSIFGDLLVSFSSVILEHGKKATDAKIRLIILNNKFITTSYSHTRSLTRGIDFRLASFNSGILSILL